MLTFGSVCSGIEAASTAWEPLGWKADWFSEIEKFPAAVLAHRWPTVPNLGDMLNLPDWVEMGLIPAPDVLVGGTPCQAFSVAGRRGSLQDERGALSLAYVELANRIDEVRHADGKPPAIIVWENVPGVLNTKDNAFGCFLAGLAGEDEPLQPAGGRWTNAGYVRGPKRTIAWRVLDAQYFGVAQRRRRVFVVASARTDFDPAAVLFESEGVRRDTPPSREAGKEIARHAECGFATAGTLDARTRGGGFPGSDGACLGHVVPVAFGGNNQAGSIDIATARNACGSGSGSMDFESETFLVQSTGYASKGHFGSMVQVDAGDPLRAKGGDTGHGGETIACAVTGDITHTLNTANNGKGCSEDGTGRGVPTIAVHGTQDPDVRYDHSHTLGRNNGAENALLTITQGWDFLGTPATEVAKPVDVHTPLRRRAPGQFENSTVTTVQQGLAVRRLTPVECERLQGFPDNHTNVPYRNKPAADGPRYKAIGNSMAVPVMHWIGARIAQQIATMRTDK